MHKTVFLENLETFISCIINFPFLSPCILSIRLKYVCRFLLEVARIFSFLLFIRSFRMTSLRWFNLQNNKNHPVKIQLILFSHEIHNLSSPSVSVSSWSVQWSGFLSSNFYSHMSPILNRRVYTIRETIKNT